MQSLSKDAWYYFVLFRSLFSFLLTWHDLFELPIFFFHELLKSHFLTLPKAFAL